MIASFFPRSGGMERAASLFNQLMSRRYERIADFIKMHYYLSQRTDSAFWRDNTRPETAGDSLLAMLEMWRHRPPGRFDFVMDYETFATANTQFVLYGMDFKTELSGSLASYPHAAQARGVCTGGAGGDRPLRRYRHIVTCCSRCIAMVSGSRSRPINHRRRRHWFADERFGGAAICDVQRPAMSGRRLPCLIVVALQLIGCSPTGNEGADTTMAISLIPAPAQLVHERGFFRVLEGTRIDLPRMQRPNMSRATSQVSLRARPLSDSPRYRRASRRRTNH